MSTSSDFKRVVAAICDLSNEERSKLLRMLECTPAGSPPGKPAQPWTAKSILEFIAYEGSNLNIAAAAHKALKEQG